MLAVIPVSDFGIFLLAFLLCPSPPPPPTHHCVFHCQGQFGLNLPHISSSDEKRKESTVSSLSVSSLDFNVVLMTEAYSPGPEAQIETNDTL